MDTGQGAQIGHEHVYLRFSDPEIGSDAPWSVHVLLRLPNLQAEAKVWFGLERPLPDFFDALAHDWRGWSGARTWQAMEGGLRIDATADALGHVVLDVELREGSGSDGWLVRADIPLDAGQLDEVAREVRRMLTQAT